jgi:hypothetical protein
VPYHVQVMRRSSLGVLALAALWSAASACGSSAEHVGTATGGAGGAALANGGAAGTAGTGATGGAVSLVPQIVGSAWQIASSPDLGVYDNRPDQQPVDFSIWQAKDGTFQLWSCIRGTKVGGNSRLFYRWEAAHLTDVDWTPNGIALMADPTVGETPGGLQAPHVIRVGDTWHMFYGDWAHICHATSTDGKVFTRVIQPNGQSGAFGEAANLVSRDPMVFVAPNEFRIYYTSDAGEDYARTSPDLVSFSASRVVALGGEAGVTCCSAECPFVVQPASGGDYFLFRTQAYGQDAQTRVYRSADPFDFGINDDRFLIETLPIAAPEILLVDGQYYVAHLRPDLQGIQVAKLTFAPNDRL